MNNSAEDKENECTHVKDLIEPEKVRFISKKCSQCETATFNDTFICLNCGKVFCESTHLKPHLEQSKHNITIDLKELKVHCEKCDKLTPKQVKYHYQHLYETRYFQEYNELFSKEEIYEIKYKKFISLLKEHKFKKVIIMVGAGISTTAGIPDFRSNTGLFKQLQEKYDLQSPEEFFSIELFRKNPYYFYEFTKLFDLSKTKPTLTHKFIAYMLYKDYAKYLFTQNIDGLEDKAKIPHDKIIFAHGTFSQAHCPNCKIDIDIKKMNEYIEKGEILKCDKCNGPCKPNVVFYGENLPKRFFEKMEECKDSDLVIIMGTSLIVQPFASIPDILDRDAWKVAINKDYIGYYNYEFLTMNSIFISGITDDVCLKIIKDCEWENDYKKFVKDTYDDDEFDLIQKMEMLSVNDNKNEKKEESKENETKNENETKEIPPENNNNNSNNV